MKGKNNPMFGKKRKNNHKIDCICSFCKAKRGEYKGKNSPSWGGNYSVRGKKHYMFGKICRALPIIKYYHSRMRSSYEIKYAEWLRKNHIKWRYEPKAFPLSYEIGMGKIKETTYTPDFYLPKTKEYIEIKGWWRGDAEEKFANFQQQYPNIKITVLMKPELQKMGVLK